MRNDRDGKLSACDLIDGEADAQNRHGAFGNQQFGEFFFGDFKTENNAVALYFTGYDGCESIHVTGDVMATNPAAGGEWAFQIDALAGRASPKGCKGQAFRRGFKAKVGVIKGNGGHTRPIHSDAIAQSNAVE